MKMKVYSLTTTDNPYDPNVKFDEWLAHEKFSGSRCLKALGRFVFTSDSLSNKENINEVNRAIDEIIKYDLAGVFKRVESEVEVE